MSSQLGEAFVPIRATLDKLDGDLAQARGKLDKALGSIGGVAAKGFAGLQTVAVAGVAALAAVGVGAVVLGGQLIGLGSDAEEMMGKFNVVFANTGGQVTEQLDAFAEAAGRSRFELMEMAATFGDTLKPMGFTEEAAADMSVQLSQLAVDLGSFNNMEMDEALRRLQGTLIGSHENALAFGVIINENTLKAELAANGWDKLTGAELEQAKVQARLNLLMKGTTDAQGDAIRTSGSWANQMRALQATLKDAGTEIGLKLLPAVTPLLSLFGELASRALPLLAGIFEERILPVLATVSEAIQSLIGNMEAGMTPVMAFKIAIWEAFPPEIAEQILNIVDVVINLTRAFQNLFREQSFFEDDPAWLLALKAFGDFVRPLVQGILDMVAQFVSWKDVLMAVGVVIASIVLPVLYSIVTAVAPIIAVAVALVAVIALVRNAWENDWGGIRTFLMDAWQNTIQPALQQLWEWLSINVPAALETLRAWWVDTAWPAIQAALEIAWQVISFIFEAYVFYITQMLIPTLVALWDYWVNVAWPAISAALQTAWAAILPLLTALKDFVINTVIPTVQDLYTKWTTIWWPTIQTVLQNVWTIIKFIFEELGRWINDNIVPWIEFLHQKWVEEIWPAISAALQTAWGIIQPLLETAEEWLKTNIPTALDGLRAAWETVWGALAPLVQPAKDAVEAILDAAERFWAWLTSHTFSFNISLPDLPDWAIPGSPLPIHTAWANFAQEMNRMSIAPKFDLGGVEAALAVNGGGGGAETVQQDNSRRINLINPRFEGVRDAGNLLEELEALAR